MNPASGDPRAVGGRRSSAACLLLAILAALPWSTPRAQDIYRCDQGGQTVFSDLPCDDGAEVYRSGHRLSVIEPADDLDGIAEENRAFVAERRRRLAERRERAEQLQAAAARARLRAAARAETRGNRLIIGPGRRIGETFRQQQPDPRNTERRSAPDDERRVDRRTLLSRSGSDRPIIPREPPGYQ